VAAERRGETGGRAQDAMAQSDFAGATFSYQPAPPAVVGRARELAAACAEFGVSLTAAALQFPLGHPCMSVVRPAAVWETVSSDRSQIWDVKRFVSQNSAQPLHTAVPRMYSELSDATAQNCTYFPAQSPLCTDKNYMKFVINNLYTLYISY
jgi:hypothetical protein